MSSFEFRLPHIVPIVTFVTLSYILIRLLRLKKTPSNVFVWFTNFVRRSSTERHFRACAYTFKFVKYSFKAPESHTHPIAFEARANAVSSLRDHLKASGFATYDPSLAQRDVHFDVKGHRHVHSVQDMMGPLRSDDYIPRDSVVTMIDQDYYYDDLSEFAPRPIAFYTVIPSALSGRGNDSAYYYNSVDTLTEQVEGGAVYKQRLFDYSADILCIEHKIWSRINGFTLYNVHRVFEPNSNKAMVFLSPSYTYLLPLSVYKLIGKICMCHDIEVPMLAKVANVVETEAGFLVGKFGSAMGPLVSIKRAIEVSPDSSVNIPEAVYFGLLYLSQIPSSTWSVTQVNRYLLDWKCECVSKLQMVTLYEYYKFPSDKFHRVNYIVLPSRPEQIYDEGKKNAIQLCPSIVTPGCVISITETAAESYVNERVLPNQNFTRFDDDIKGFAIEFVKNVVRNPGKLVPDDLETVERAQSGAAQRLRNKQERNHLPKEKNVIMTSIKKEPALKTGPARGVNTVPTSHTHATARYAKPFSKVLKAQGESYNVGMNNVVVGECVQHLANKAANGVGDSGPCYIAESDFSKLDETISQDIREYVVEAALLRAYHSDHHDELKKIFEDEKNQQCIVGHVKFNGLYKNLSGSGFTTLINTLTNLFWKYVLHRTTGYSVLESMKMFGLNYGDDGLHMGPAIKYDSGELSVKHNIEREEYIKLCLACGEKLGLKVKVTLASPFDPAYFLGREYPNPAVSGTSLSRPSRCLRRMPISVTGNAKDLPHRLLGYYVTELHVPLVGDYLRAVGRIYGIELNVNTTVSYEQDRDLYFKLKSGVVPYCQADDDCLIDAVCRDLNLTQVEVCLIINKLQTANTIDELSLIFIDLEIPDDESMYARV